MGSHPKLGTSLQGIFAARLRTALDARGVAASADGSATALAQRLGRSVSTAARWLNGEMLPSLDTLTEIATAYGLSLDFLLGLSKQDRGLEENGAHAHAETPRDPILIHTEIRDADGTLLTEVDFEYVLLPQERFMQAVGISAMPDSYRRHFGDV